MEKQQNYGQYDLEFSQHFSAQQSMKAESQFRNSSLPEENNFQIETVSRRSKKSLRNDQIEALNQKRQNLEQFMSTIGEISNHPIRADILDHCERVSLTISHTINKNAILRLVKNRVDKMIKNKRIKKNWSQEDINILVWVISKYCQFHGVSQIKDGISDADWASIAQLIPGVTGKSCMFKWLSLKKSNLAQNSWGEDQSLLLHEIVKIHGQNSWCRISQQLYLKNNSANKVYRCPKQCREHWNCYLNPKLKKGPWEKKQDYLLLRAVKQLQGIKKWAQIVKLFNGRTQNALKNRFTLIVQKQQKDHKNKKKLNQLQLVQFYLKRYQNIYSIDQQKLKFLRQKRQQIIQNQNKKKPKKNRTKKTKFLKNNSQQQDQYIQNNRPIIDKTINLRSNQNSNHKGYSNSRQYEPIYNSTPSRKQKNYYQNQSVDMKSSGRYIDPDSEIYQSDEQVIGANQFQPTIYHDNRQINSNISIQKYPELISQINNYPNYQQYQPKQQYSAYPQFQPYAHYSQQSVNNYKQKYYTPISNNNAPIVKQRVTLSLPRFDNDQRSTAEQNLQIAQTQVKIVPFSQQIFQKLYQIKNQTGTVLIPCSLIRNNNYSLEMKRVNN